MRKARDEAGFTQDDLAKRLRALGHPLGRATIAEIERGARRVTIDDWLAIAAALGVAPMHLVVPFETNKAITLDVGGKTYVMFEAAETLQVGKQLELLPDVARDWIAGEEIYPGANLDDFGRYYGGHVPPPRRYFLEQKQAEQEGREPGPPLYRKPRRIGRPGGSTIESLWALYEHDEQEER